MVFDHVIRLTIVVESCYINETLISQGCVDIVDINCVNLIPRGCLLMDYYRNLIINVDVKCA